MPYLETAKNDPFLEAAVVGNCNFIIYDGRNSRSKFDLARHEEYLSTISVTQLFKSMVRRLFGK